MSLLDRRGSSYRAIYRREVESALLRGVALAAPVTERDLAPLPGPVQTYLRRVGVVGKPHVRSFRATLRGQIRKSADAAWMSFKAEQHEFFDEPERLFLMRASLYGIPFEALHRYVGPHATMQVRVASLVDIVDARGPEMDESETVTLFNDICIMAPAQLVDAGVSWRTIDERNVEGTFTNAGHTVRAILSFDETGDLVGFVSNDRYQSADGKRYLRFPWATPVGGYRDFGGFRLAGRGEAIWREPRGDFVYARMDIVSIEYDVGASRARLSRLP